MSTINANRKEQVLFITREGGPTSKLIGKYYLITDLKAAQGIGNRGCTIPSLKAGGHLSRGIFWNEVFDPTKFDVCFEELEVDNERFGELRSGLLDKHTLLITRESGPTGKLIDKYTGINELKAAQGGSTDKLTYHNISQAGGQLNRGIFWNEVFDPTKFNVSFEEVEVDSKRFQVLKAKIPSRKQKSQPVPLQDQTNTITPVPTTRKRRRKPNKKYSDGLSNFDFDDDEYVPQVDGAAMIKERNLARGIVIVVKGIPTTRMPDQLRVPPNIIQRSTKLS